MLILQRGCFIAVVSCYAWCCSGECSLSWRDYSKRHPQLKVLKVEFLILTSAFLALVKISYISANDSCEKGNDCDAMWRNSVRVGSEHYSCSSRLGVKLSPNSFWHALTNISWMVVFCLFRVSGKWTSFRVFGSLQQCSFSGIKRQGRVWEENEYSVLSSEKLFSSQKRPSLNLLLQITYNAFNIQPPWRRSTNSSLRHYDVQRAAWERKLVLSST